MTGYHHPLYVRSLKEFGEPRELPYCKGYILKRPITGLPCYDAMGCYPLFVCRDWTQLHAGLQDLEGELVSLSLVTDPFGAYDEEMLRLCFPDVVMPFKEHFVRNTAYPLASSVSEHHRRNARKALSRLSVERCEDPHDAIDDWVHLYRQLIERHDIRGIARFSRESFDLQLRVPGIIAFRALRGERVVGMLLWYVQNGVAYYHLGAHDVLGYEMHASFSLFWAAIEYFAARGVEWLDLGAGAGLGRTGEDGLSRFKQGWATGTRTAYLCGRIFDHDRYRELTASRGMCDTAYFPAYRRGEFV